MKEREAARGCRGRAKRALPFVTHFGQTLVGVNTTVNNLRLGGVSGGIHLLLLLPLLLLLFSLLRCVMLCCVG